MYNFLSKRVQNWRVFSHKKDVWKQLASTCSNQFCIFFSEHYQIWFEAPKSTRLQTQCVNIQVQASLTLRAIWCFAFHLKRIRFKCTLSMARALNNFAFFNWASSSCKTRISSLLTMVDSFEDCTFCVVHYWYKGNAKRPLNRKQGSDKVREVHQFDISEMCSNIIVVCWWIRPVSLHLSASTNRLPIFHTSWAGTTCSLGEACGSHFLPWRMYGSWHSLDRAWSSLVVYFLVMLNYTSLISMSFT